jgi:tetratricopeptide (TPR) repeat protein
MARRQRFRPEAETIEIERNVIERFLMHAKSYFKNNRKAVVNSLIGLLALIVISIALIFVVDRITTRDQKRFDEIMYEYTRYSMIGDKEKLQLVVRELIKFVDSTYFGFPHNMAYYVMGNTQYDLKDYKNAEKNLRKYAEWDSSSVLSSLALIKAAVACEDMNDLKGALGIYRKLEDNYSGSVIADQIFFNYARLCGKMKDAQSSRKYYNKVITSFPDSPFASMARKRLFTLGVR